MRQRVQVDIAAAWVDLKPMEYDQLILELLYDRKLVVVAKSGTVVPEASRWQRLMIAKQVFEALNQQPALPTNFVRVQPIPPGADATSTGNDGLVQVNLIYGEAALPAVPYK